MNNVEIDVSGCGNTAEIHDLLRQKLDFPDYYGKNLDALWDCLTGYIAYPLYVQITGIQNLPKELQQEALQIVQVFINAEKEEPRIHVILKEK